MTKDTSREPTVYENEDGDSVGGAVAGGGTGGGAVERAVSGSICVCGLAKDYHGPKYKSDHDYKPRYPQHDRGQRALAERMFAIGYMDAPGRVAHPVKEDIEYEAGELLGESHAFVTVAELERLLKVEAAALRVVAWVDDGGQIGPWLNASGFVELRAALATDGAET